MSICIVVYSFCVLDVNKRAHMCDHPESASVIPIIGNMVSPLFRMQYENNKAMKAKRVGKNRYITSLNQPRKQKHI